MQKFSYLETKFQSTSKDYPHEQVDFILEMQRELNIWKSIIVIHHETDYRTETMIISLNEKKGLWQIHYPFMITVLEYLGMQETYFNIIKTIYRKLIGSIILDRDLENHTFSLKPGCPFSILLFNIVLEVLGRKMRWVKEIKI